jgi:hypothetical protein
MTSPPPPLLYFDLLPGDMLISCDETAAWLIVSVVAKMSWRFITFMLLWNTGREMLIVETLSYDKTVPIACTVIRNGTFLQRHETR